MDPPEHPDGLQPCPHQTSGLQSGEQALCTWPFVMAPASLWPTAPDGVSSLEEMKRSKLPSFSSATLLKPAQ